MSRKEEIAEALLSIQAVFLRPKDPFTWASGIHSPIYCDNRLTLSFPEVRRKIEKGLAELVREHFPEASALFGTSTAGIAHAALTAEILDLPMGYVRGSAKDHGRQNQIEGALSEGQPVVVVEDLISTGGSVIDCVEVLRKNGAKVLGVVSIFTYGMEKGKKRLKEADVENYSLCDLDSLLPVAAGKGYIEEKEVAKLLRFRDNPSDESWMKE
ncbi:MAG: orotate phosphoribosyltransferase [Lachnospiraceae bacterium]|nr:orotate phosphoribosyltransferase [Lachnospiraceae bacterium]